MKQTLTILSFLLSFIIVGANTEKTNILDAGYADWGIQGTSTSFWSSEAENGTISGTTEIKEGCANASGGKFVRLGNIDGNSLSFENINIDKAGTYQLSIDYFYVNSSFLNILVNDVVLGEHTFESAVWCYQGASTPFSIDIELLEGSNKIEFQVSNGKNTPLIDKIRVFDPNKIQLTISTSSDKLFAGQKAELKVSASDVLSKDIEVSFTVSGMEESGYEIYPNPVTITADSDSALAFFESIDNNGTENQTATVAISTSNEELVIGDPGLVDINIINKSTNYYLSSSAGNDTDDGLSKETPWETLEKISTTELFPGDSILFKTGDTFNGQLVVNGSGIKDHSIVISSYGNGEKPIIDGANVEGGAHLTSILINNQEYIEIEKLELVNERMVSRSDVSDNLAYGVYILNDGNKTMRNLGFRNLTIRDIYAVTIEGVPFNSIKVAAIGFKTEKNSEAGKEKHIRDVLVEDCYVTRTGRYGIHTGHGGGDEGIGNDSINRNMNFIFRNNHFYQTGGSCITPGRTYNCLIENNIFDYPGSGIDPRMANRGSGAWFWSCRNVIAQFNKSYHVRGYGDSYGMHIDFGNENVILQYNYSEDSEGGFVEILGKNINSTYRFNVSVNDGFRDNKGNSIWVSDFAGTNNRISSDSNFVYNNTIYVDANITPDISIVGKNTFIYNNIFYATGAAKIGEEVTVEIDPGSELKMSNNLFFGNISNTFKNYDTNPVYGNPGFANAGELHVDAYQIVDKQSPVLKTGKSFPEPIFPLAGKGIFKDVKLIPEFDLFGNSVNVSTEPPNIGADNGDPNITGIANLKNSSNLFVVYPNPVKNTIYVSFEGNKLGKLNFVVSDLQGRIIQSNAVVLAHGENSVQLLVQAEIRNGIYILKVAGDGFSESKSFVLVR